MHARARRLADNQDAGRGGGLYDRAGAKGEVRFAEAAGADLGQQGVEVGAAIIAHDGSAYRKGVLHAGMPSRASARSADAEALDGRRSSGYAIALSRSASATGRMRTSIDARISRRI